jgi:hypothetical protein
MGCLDCTKGLLCVVVECLKVKRVGRDWECTHTHTHAHTQTEHSTSHNSRGEALKCFEARIFAWKIVVLQRLQDSLDYDFWL